MIVSLIKTRRAIIASLVLLGGWGVSSAAAQSTVADPKSAKENPEEFSRVEGLFDVDLPKTVEKYKIKVILHPHFGDFLHRDYVRIPVGVRVGISNHTEINAEVESYLTHGLKKGEAGNGLASFRLGVKHEWRQWLKSLVDTSTGFNSNIPVGRPPLDLTDGYNHFAPYISFSKRLPRYPKLTPFGSLGTDLIWKSSVPGSFAKNAAHSHSMGVSTGFLLDENKLKYTLVFSYWTTSLIGHGNKQFVSVNPSVLWELPPALKFYSAGRWIFGIGVKALYGPDGTDFSTSGKLRGEFRFSRMFRASPGASEKKPAGR